MKFSALSYLTHTRSFFQNRKLIKRIKTHSKKKICATKFLSSGSKFVTDCCPTKICLERIQNTVVLFILIYKIHVHQIKQHTLQNNVRHIYLLPWRYNISIQYYISPCYIIFQFGIISPCFYTEFFIKILFHRIAKLKNTTD